MKTPRTYIGALVVFCVAVLVIGSAGAAAMMQKGTGNTFKNTSGKGPTNGMANMTQLNEFRTAHQDGFPAFANCTSKGPMKGVANETRMLEMLDNLTEKGYDVSAISAAVTSGDYKTAKTLLKEFMTAHPEVFPAIGDGIGKSPMKGVANETRMLEILDNLTAKGYDVSAISAAVTSGDYKTAKTLLKEFMTANPDAHPARDDGTGGGHMGGKWRAQNT